MFLPHDVTRFSRGNSQGVEIWRAIYGTMFCSRGFAKGVRKFAFQLKAEFRLTQLQSIKRVKID